MLQTSLTSAMYALEFDWRSSVEAWRPSPSQKWKGQQALCHLKEEKKSSWGKAKSWKGFLTPSACQEKLVGQSKKLKRLPHTLCIPKRWFPPRGRAQITWSRYFRRNTSILYQQTANCWKYYKTTSSLNILGIWFKEHQIQEELRTLTFTALSITYLFATRINAFTDWSAEDAVRNGGVRLFLKPRPRINKRDFWPTQFFWLTDWHAESLVTRRGADLHRHQTFPTQHKDVNDPTVDSFPLWYKRQWGSPAIKRSSKQEQSAHFMSCSEVKAILNSIFRTLWWHLNKLT